MRAVALAASASLVFVGCAVYVSSQGTTTAISEVILPMGDMPTTAGITKATRQLIDEAVNGEPMAKSISTKLTQIAKDAKSEKSMDKSTVNLIDQAVQEAVHSAEGAVKKDVQIEVKSAVKEAIHHVLAADTKLTRGALNAISEVRGTSDTRPRARGSRGRHSVQKGAARAEESKEYAKELNHITGELTNQLGGLVKTNFKIDRARHPSARAAHAAHKTRSSGDKQEVATLVQAASADEVIAHKSAKEDGVVDHRAGATTSGSGEAAVRGSAEQDKADVKSQSSTQKYLSKIENDKAAEVMEEQDARAARRHSKDARASKDAADALLNMVKKASSDKLPDKKAKALSKTVRKAETLVKADGTKVPISSRHDPAYVHSEQSRDQQAAGMLKKLQDLKKAKLAKKLALHPVVEARKPRENRNTIAEKYLKVMENQALKKPVSRKKALDRSVLAQKYLQQLKKISPTMRKKKNAPKGSRHNAKYVNDEHSRDSQAATDMALLKHDQALVQKGNTVEKVKLSKTIVKGPDTLQKEREALTRPKTDRTKIANLDLKKIRPLMHTFKKTHVGKYFHDTTVPKNMLAPKKLHLATKAQVDLHELQHLEKHPTRHTAASDRNLVALVDLKKLEAKTGQTALPRVRVVKPLSADALAAKDLKSLGPLPADEAAKAGHDATAVSMISKDLTSKSGAAASSVKSAVVAGGKA